MTEKQFRALADQWYDETGMLSSPSQIAAHPNYQAIIYGGAAVLPFIFRDLRDRGGHWYTALRTITGQSPLTGGYPGSSRAVKEAWLTWGRERGLVE